MFIPWEKFSNIPFFSCFKGFFTDKKIKQNVDYISKNKAIVLKKLKEKKHFKVVFYVYDLTKWKCQKIYDLMEEDERFSPLVVVTKNSVTSFSNPSFQTKKEIEDTYNYFKNKNMNVKLGYDFEKQRHIPFEKFSCDIIIYQHPWYVETSQGPVVCSKFALTYYIPYDIPTTDLEIDYGLRFHSYIENFVVFNNEIKETFQSKMKNKGENLLPLGQPSCDYIKSNKIGDYVIYAPHWTINHEKTIAYSTFKENGKFILDYAKKHPEFSWVFKPHPMLKKAILDNNFMTKGEVEKYYSDWEKLALASYDCNYYEIFNNSQLMITDCSTFLVEYFLTGKPLLQLLPEKEPSFNNFVKRITKNYYKITNNDELEKRLNEILINNEDTMKQSRLEALKKFDFVKNSSKCFIQNIINTIED